MNKIISLFKHIGCYALVALLLTACASQQPNTTSIAKTWTVQKTQLMQLNNWQLKAAMGVHTPSKSGMVTLFWKQKSNRYNARVSGPLGVGGIRIEGRPDQVTLWKSATEKISAKTPEALMQRELGWGLPISDLYYWIRGLPVPHKPTTHLQIHQGLLTQLDQAGWQIQYTDYQSVETMTLPKTLLINGPKLRVKIVIERWQILK